MQIPVLIERVPGNGYRAKSGEPFAEVGVGATPDDAMQHLQKSVQRRINAGERLVALDITANEHAWLPYAGMFDANDPTIKKWLKI